MGRKKEEAAANKLELSSRFLKDYFYLQDTLVAYFFWSMFVSVLGIHSDWPHGLPIGGEVYF